MHTDDDVETFLAALRAATTPPPEEAADPDGPTVTDWTWHLLPVLHEHLPPSARDDWARRLHPLLADGRTTDGGLGLAAVHHWHAHTVVPLLASGEDQEGAFGPLAPLAALHQRAARHDPVDEQAWRSALGPVLHAVHHAAYDRAGAYAVAHAGARDYALANGSGPQEADAYGHRYAGLSTEANADSFARAHARVLGDALARAYAADRAEAYAETYPGAQLRAVVRAVTTAPGSERRTAAAVALTLAQGLSDALRSLPARIGAGP